MRDFRTYARAEARARPGPDGRARPERRRQVQPAGGALLRLHRPLAAHAQRARADPLRRAGGAGRRALQRRRRSEHELSVGYGAGPDGAPAVKRMTRRRRAGRAAARRRLPPAAQRLPARPPGAAQGPAGRCAARTSTRSSRRSGRCARATRREYSRVLAQRNALLARIRAGRASHATLADLGPRAGRQRRWPCARTARAAVELLAEPFAAARRAARPQRRGAARVPARARAPASVDEFVAELQARLASDLERGFSGHGPHRDELAILRDGRELRVVRLPGRAAPGAAGAAARRARRARARARGARR